MNFDLHEINYAYAIGTWVAVFFGVFSAGATLAWLLAPTVAGVGGHGKLYRHLTKGSMGIVCWVLGGIAPIATAWLVWISSVNSRGIVMILLGPWVTPGTTGANLVQLADRISITTFFAILGAFGGFTLVPTLLEACSINFGRVFTIAGLTWKEAVRRRALYVFVVFALLFMFAGWFLSDPGERPDRQVKNYVTFVLTTITWLTLPVMMLLSAWGIPEDIRVRSMHTVVTKPVRRNEIFLGRFVGFSLVGTAVVVVMGVIGYIWVSRQIPALVTTGEAKVEGRDIEFGRTRDGNLRVQVSQLKGEPKVYEAASPAAMRQENPEAFRLYRAATRKYVDGDSLTARVPVHAKLSFYDRNGFPATGGINVGDIWEHRSFIEGGTKARASYRFENVSPAMLVDATELQLNDAGEEVAVTEKRLRIETHFEAFRSYKGDMKRSLLVQLHFVKGLRRELSEGVAGIDLNEPGVTDYRPISRSIVEGNFEDAAERFAQLANGYESESLEFTEQARKLLPIGYTRVAELFAGFNESWAASIRKQAENVVAAVRSQDSAAMAAALKELARLFTEHGDKLEAEIVDIDVPYTPYTIKEFVGNVIDVPAKLSVQGSTEKVDLFEDIVHGGELRVEVACLDNAQYLGMARPDLFIRMPDNPFLAGFAKAVLGIWMLLLLIVLVGVTVSTFVKGPVATLAVGTFVGVGVFFHAFLLDVVSGKSKGSGAIESSYRLYAHLNPNVDLDKTTTVAIIQGADSTIKGGLWVVSNTVPDLNVFFLNKWIASGFDVRWDAGLVPAVFTLLAYLLPCLLLGFYGLKLRELEAK